MSQIKHGSTTFTGVYELSAAAPHGLTSGAAYADGEIPLTSNDVGTDDCAHPVTILGNAVTNHSGKNFTITGTDANDVAITNTIIGPNGNVTVTSTKRFKTVTSVAVSATTGADTFDVGWSALASTPWVVLNYLQSHFSVGVGVVLVSGSANYDLEKTYDEVDTNATVQVAYNDGTMAAKTDSSDVGLTTPVKAIRLDVNSHTSGVLRFTVLQGNNC